MKYYSDSYKNFEIKEMFQIIFNNRIIEGYKKIDARRIALDAINLRFNISDERVRKILYDKSIGKNRSSLFYNNNVEIIQYLQELISVHKKTINIYLEITQNIGDTTLDSMISEKMVCIQNRIKKYECLIKLLEEVNVYYKGYK